MDTNQRSELIRLAGPDGLESLASELSVTPSALERWRSTGRGIRPRATRMLEYLADRTARREALQRAGVPECEWLNSFQMPVTRDLKELQRALAEKEAHQATCPICLEKKRYLEEHDFGPAKRPPVNGILPSLIRLVEAFPRPLRPAVGGAVALGAIMLLREAFQLIFVLTGGNAQRVLTYLGQAGVALVAAMFAGASGGLVYAAVHPITKRLGILGVYLGSFLAVEAYILALAAVASYAFGQAFINFSDPNQWIVLGVMGVMFGLVLGFSLAKGREAKSSSVAP